MAIQGETYATIDASVANSGMSTLSISGNTPITGDAGLSVVIRWSFNPETAKGGITGTEWYIGNSYSPITGYPNDEEFNQLLSTMSSEEAKTLVDSYFSNWDNSQKEEFWKAQAASTFGCLDIVAQ